MKFTREEAGKEIAARLSKTVENINAWDRTIKENVETLWSILGEDNEIELSDFADKALPLFNTTAGFLRKTNADLAKSFEDKIKDLQSKITTPTPPPDPKPDPVADESLLKRIEELERENKEAKRAAMIAGKRQGIADKLKEKGIKDAKWIGSLLDIVNIDEGTDIDKEVDRYTGLYNSSRSGYTPNLTPDKPGEGADTYVSDTIKAAAAMAVNGRLR